MTDISVIETLVADIEEPYRSAYLAASLNRDRLMASHWVGCFYCLLVFSPKTIKEWADGGQTARCPVCGVDTVLPLTTEQLDSDFLAEMCHFWFGTTRQAQVVNKTVPQ